MPTKTDYVLIAIGAFAAVLLTSYIPSSMKVLSLEGVKDEYAGCISCNEKSGIFPPSIKKYSRYKSASIESIPGIDLKSLNIARQKGLI